jgi:hypothetical protein
MPSHLPRSTTTRESEPAAFGAGRAYGPAMRLAFGFALAAVSLLAATSAHAEWDGRPNVIVATQPSEGQVDVPIDVSPRVFTELSETGGDDFYAPRLSLLRGEEDVDSTQRMLTGFPETTVLSPTAVLEPGTTYTLYIEGTDEGYGPVSRSVSFTTGAEKATPIARAPSFEILSAEFDASQPENSSCTSSRFGPPPSRPTPTSSR